MCHMKDARKSEIKLKGLRVAKMCADKRKKRKMISMRIRCSRRRYRG